MKNFKVATLFFTIGLFTPLLVKADAPNWGNTFEVLVYAFIFLILLELLGVIGLIVRYLNSRSKHPNNLIDYVVMPLSAGLLVINGILVWLSFAGNDSFSNALLSINLFVISLIATLVPRSWLAKFPTKKTKNT